MGLQVFSGILYGFFRGELVVVELAFVVHEKEGDAFGIEPGPGVPVQGLYKLFGKTVADEPLFEGGKVGGRGRFRG